MLGDCPTIHVGGAYELFWKVIQQILWITISGIGSVQEDGAH